MAKAISNKNVLNAKFKVAEFDGEWLASFGKPELKGSWLIYGKSGSGKTTFALQLCKYLSRFGRVAYNTLEQGLSQSFQTAWQRVDMLDAGSQIIVLDKEPLSEVEQRLQKRKAPDVVIFDSTICLIGLTKKDYMKLLADYPQTLFIFLAHEKSNMPDPPIAETIRRLSEIKIRVEGYKAFVTTRYEDPAKDEGGADFIIWEQGAIDYHLDNI